MLSSNLTYGARSTEAERIGRLIRQLIDHVWPRPNLSHASKVLGVGRDTLSRLGTRKHPPPVHIALRYRDVLGFRLEYWALGAPQDFDPRAHVPRHAARLQPRDWDDRPPSYAPHGRLLKKALEDAGYSLTRASQVLKLGSRSGLRHLLCGDRSPNARVAYWVWKELGFWPDWWRLAEPPSHLL